MASRLARAFPAVLEVTDGRKSWGHNLSEGSGQKPRPLERVEEERHEDASCRTSPSVWYCVPRPSHVMGRLRVLKVCISLIDFVVKTTQGSNNAPFDVDDDMVRRHATTPSIEGVA